jgi:hypothetical protein
MLTHDVVDNSKDRGRGVWVGRRCGVRAAGQANALRSQGNSRQTRRQDGLNAGVSLFMMYQADVANMTSPPSRLCTCLIATALVRVALHSLLD